MHYQQLIITEPASNFRALARQGIKGRWGDAFLKGLIYSLVISLPGAIILTLSGFSLADVYTSYTGLLTGTITQTQYVDVTSGMNSPLLTLTGLYQLLITGAMMLGITQVFLRYRRKQEAPTELLFSGFSNFGRALALYLLMTLFTVLWTLLFIIPGIIAAYRYRLAFYILAENPNVGPLEAINISKGLMRGNKWKLFCLDISFIGWALLVGIAVSVISMPFSATTEYGVYLGIDNQIISALIYAVVPAILSMYMGTSAAAFFERASGLLKYHDEVQTNVPPAQYS